MMNKKTRRLSPVLFLLLLAPPVLLHAGLEVRVIKGPDDLPAKFSSFAQKGDFFLSDGEFYALLGGSPRRIVTSANYPYGNAMGSLLGFVPARENISGDLNIGSPVVRVEEKTRHIVYSTIKPVETGPEAVFEATGYFEDKSGRTAEIKTTYIFYPGQGRIDIASTIVNTGQAAFEDLNYSLFIDTYNRFHFSPYHDKKFPHLNFRVYQKKGHDLGWISFSPAEKAQTRRPGRLAPGEKFELRGALLVEDSDIDLLGKIYHILEIQPAEASIAIEKADDDWLELTVRDVQTSAVFYRRILESAGSKKILLPPGLYRVQASFFPALAEEMLEVKVDRENSVRLVNPPLGTLKIKIRNSQGEAVLGKVSFLGISPTRSPYFRPDNPIETGRSYEGFKNSCFPGEEGLEIKLPPGSYLASASCGPEYSVDQKAIEVVVGENGELVFVIDRVVKTPGLVSFDPHLHTTRSDGTPSIPERIRSVVAEGIEVIAATDHNTVTDYFPDLKKLGLEKKLAVLPGNEITTPDVIHFNSYPLEIRPNEPMNGAINSASDEAGQLFAESRKKNPAAIIQVNHPRAGDLGYFNNLNLDPETAATALPGLSLEFDLLEVLNGPYYFSSNQSSIEDWFHLLNRGYYFPIVGSSDSHGIDRGEPGYSRTYIMYSGGEANNLDLQSFLQSLKKGRSFVTNGPLLALLVNGRASLGDTISVKGGRVDIQAQAWSAPWVEIGEVRLVLNGERRIIFPLNGAGRKAEEFRQEISLTLAEDTSICLEALGRRTMFPVLQSLSRTGEFEGGTIPYAITNPVFVDVDGNGRFDPPRQEKIRLVSASGKNRKMILR